jgi:hypothetical protein
VRFQQHSVFREEAELRGVKRSIFAKKAECNEAFLAMTPYLRKSDDVKKIYTLFNKFV